MKNKQYLKRDLLFERRMDMAKRPVRQYHLALQNTRHERDTRKQVVTYLGHGHMNLFGFEVTYIAGYGLK